MTKEGFEQAIKVARVAGNAGFILDELEAYYHEITALLGEAKQKTEHLRETAAEIDQLLSSYYPVLAETISEGSVRLRPLTVQDLSTYEIAVEQPENAFIGVFGAGDVSPWLFEVAGGDPKDIPKGKGTLMVILDGPSKEDARAYPSLVGAAELYVEYQTKEGFISASKWFAVTPEELALALAEWGPKVAEKLEPAEKE